MFLFLLFSEIEANGDKIKTVSKNLGRTPQNLNYHLKKLRTLGFIERIQSYPYSIYRLTPLGQRIKENLAQSDSVRPLWRCHALIVGFDIKDFGNFSWDIHPKVLMNNWHYAYEKFQDSYGEWVVNVQSTGLLKIYCPEMYDENDKRAFANMENIAVNLANKIVERDGMRIGLLKIIREGHKELIGSEKLAKLLGKTNMKKIRVDKSDKTDLLEEQQGSDSIEQLLSLPSKFERLEDSVGKVAEILGPLKESIDLEIQNKKLHQAVLEDMRDTLKEIKESLKR